jgi:hypothetical protein
MESTASKSQFILGKASPSHESVNEIESRIININSSNASLKNNSTFNSDVVFKFPGLVKANQDYIKKIQFQLLDACIPVSF